MIIIFSLLMILAFTLATSLACRRIILWREAEIHSLTGREKDIEQQYRALKLELSTLKDDILGLETALDKLQSTVRPQEQGSPEPGAATVNFEEFLISQGIVNQEQCERAVRFITASGNGNLRMEDALVLLGFASYKDVKAARKKFQP
ncbi:MAG: hypothetical protein EOM25_01380 [Deltaproteobacteria bacterium]|nr:hypothetical protein [Deltaproteobacteria bacterium]